MTTEMLKGSPSTTVLPRMCPFLVPCAGESRGWRKVMRPYSGRVPSSVWAHLNYVFIVRANAGDFYPEEPLVAYQFAVAKLEEKANSPRELKRASLKTYLWRTAEGLLNDYVNRPIARLNAKNKKLRDLVAKVLHDSSEDEGENADIHLMDIVPDAVESLELPLDITLQEYGEEVAYLPYSERREAMSRAFVQKLFAFLAKTASESNNPLAKEALELFQNFLYFNGNTQAVWEKMHISRATFFRKWNYCARFVRKMCAQMTL